MLANTRKGKQVLNVKPPDKAVAVAPALGELVAAIGENDGYADNLSLILAPTLRDLFLPLVRR